MALATAGKTTKKVQTFSPANHRPKGSERPECGPTGKRVSSLNPDAEWIVQDVPELRTVDRPVLRHSNMAGY